ncbi:MAG: hypothetical protein KDA86_23105 [Planctomycetaceae bacterium]|nr:hypothetical protein [Planctomycetaceae bacterium]MCA9110509.1 hypothetical protein [Planctomycetaceae bacterium]
MDQELIIDLECPPDSKYRVVAHCPPQKTLEEFFDSRIKALRLMEELADQGFAVMLSQIPTSTR